MDCIILVGNRENYREVTDEHNKAFLEINGRAILHIMLEELRAVDEIDRLLLVGPQKRMDALLASAYPEGYGKPVLTFEQRNDLMENAWLPIRCTADEQPHDRYVLFLPSDIPLITAEEVRRFIAKADMTRYDFVTGLVAEETLVRFAPRNGQPGIKMLCFHLACNSYRPNNMHMVRPNAVANIDYIRKLYGMRYQKKLINGLKLLYAVASSPLGLRGFIYFGCMRLSLLFRGWGRPGLARMAEKRLDRARGEGGVGELLGARFKTVVTASGGTTIDVDNEEDYATVCRQFDAWRAMLKADDAAETAQK